jgi:iron complex transport system substrate-binding protein
MRRWLALSLIVLCWVAVGFAVFGRTDGQNQAQKPVPHHVERIVSLAPNLTEILFALGLDEQVVGVTLHCNYPPAAAEKPKVGTFWQPNIEAVIAAKPDLVIALRFTQQRDIVERLTRIGYNCLTVNVDKVGELFKAIEEIGFATGKAAQAAELASSLRTKLNRLSALIATKERLRLLWVIDREPLRVAGRDTFVNELIELAGGENAIGPTVHKYPPIGSEQVIACAADVIIEPAMASESLAEQQRTAIEHWSRFKNVPAVANQRVYVIPPDTVCRLGPRLYEGVETVARCLRPGLFAD